MSGYNQQNKKKYSLGTPFKCHGCQQLIFVSDDYKSPNGKRMPMQAVPDGQEPTIHNCPNARSKPFECQDCNQKIYLDSTRKSKTGKRIPLDANTGEYHQCPAKAQFPPQGQSEQQQTTGW